MIHYFRFKITPVRHLLSSLFLFVVSVCSAQYNALLWEISGNGLKKPSYLYGTMHTADSRIIKKSEVALPFLKKCKAFALELDPEAVVPTELISGLMMGKEHSLKQMISPADYVLLDSLVKAQMGIPLLMLDNVAPVFIATIVQQTSMGLSNSNEKNAPALDIYLHQLAKKQKKKLFGLETAAEQLTALNSLSFQEQATLLVENLHQTDSAENSGLKLVEFYLAENLDSLLALNDATEMPKIFYDALITQRNVRMADRIVNHIAQQTTFVAIGALHLPAEDGVVALLRKKGFTIKPVQ